MRRKLRGRVTELSIVSLPLAHRKPAAKADYLHVIYNSIVSATAIVNLWALSVINEIIACLVTLWIIL